MRKTRSKRQYTIRDIPDGVDKALRKKARETDKSFNQVALEALALGAGTSLRPNRDFSFIVGSMSREEALEIERAIREQRQIDPRIWK